MSYEEDQKRLQGLLEELDVSEPEYNDISDIDDGIEDLVAGTSEVSFPQPEIQEGVRRRCAECAKQRKTRYHCKKCLKFLCLEHAKIISTEC